MNVVFFGSSKFVIPIIEVLQKNFDLALVVTTDQPSPRLRPARKNVLTYCLTHQIPHLSVTNLSDPTIRYTLDAASNAAGTFDSAARRSILGVVADFGLILPSEILNIFPKGILNIHPSLLPKYRGPTPVQEAILNGDRKTGVTIIKLDEEVDHGSILAQVKEPIFDNDTAETLYERLFKIGAQLLPQTINIYINLDLIGIKNKLNSSEQDHSKATFTKRLTRQDGYFEADHPPSKEKLERMIRAYYPWPGAWSKFRIMNKELRIKLLPQQKIQVEGKKPTGYKDFLNGYPEGKELIKKLT